MNIYQRELKKLIVLHDRVQKEVVRGTRMWEGEVTGLRRGWRVILGSVAGEGFSWWLRGWQCFAAASVIQPSRQSVDLFFPVVFTFERGFPPSPSLSLSHFPRKLWIRCTFGPKRVKWFLDDRVKVKSAVKMLFSFFEQYCFLFIHFKKNKRSWNSVPTFFFIQSSTLMKSCISAYILHLFRHTYKWRSWISVGSFLTVSNAHNASTGGWWVTRLLITAFHEGGNEIKSCPFTSRGRAAWCTAGRVRRWQPTAECSS